MTTVDETSEIAIALYKAHMKDREEDGNPNVTEVTQPLSWEKLRPAIDLVWVLSAIDIETFSDDLEADTADMAQSIASKTDEPARIASYFASLAHRHSSAVSLRVARHLLTHAIDQLEERTAG